MHTAAATADATVIRTRPKRPRRIRADALGPDFRSRVIAPLPAERLPPFLILRFGRGFTLVTPWPRRRNCGLSDQQRAQAEGIVQSLNTCEGWNNINAAWITEDRIVAFEPVSDAWVRRKLNDNVSLPVRA